MRRCYQLFLILSACAAGLLFLPRHAHAVVFYAKDWETASGWTSGDDDAGCDGDRDYWGRVTCRHHAGVGTTSCWCAGNREGQDALDPDCGHYYDCQNAFLITEAIDISNYTNVTCSFYRWLDSYAGDYFEVYYSQNGTTWTQWDSRAGSYAAWTLCTYGVPAGWTTLYVKFVFNTNTNTWDKEGAYIDDFSLNGDPPALTVTNPASGGYYSTGIPLTISWNRSGGIPSSIEILKTSDWGGSWQTLVSGLSGTTSSWIWSNPSPISGGTAVVARAYYTQNAAPVYSDSPSAGFTVGYWSLIVNSPQGGQTYPIGMQLAVNWAASALPAEYYGFVIYRSTNGGGSWSTVASGRPGTERAYAWNTTGWPASSSSVIRVSGLRYAGDPAPVNSDGPIFVLATAPAQTFSVPSASGSYSDLSPLTIQWNNAGQTVNSYVLKHSSDGGATWPESFATLGGSATSWLWDMPRPPGANHKVELFTTTPNGTYNVVSGIFTVRNDPAAFTWNNASGGLWSDSLNWTPHQVPTIQDTAYITAPGQYTVSITSGGQTIGRLVLGHSPSADTTHQTLFVNCSTCSLRIGANSIIRSTGVLRLQQAAVVSVIGQGVALTDSGTVYLSEGINGGEPTLRLGSNDSLNVLAGVINMVGGSHVSAPDGTTAALVNRGCITAFPGPGWADISAPLFNYSGPGRTPGTIDIFGCAGASRFHNFGDVIVHPGGDAHARGNWDNQGTISISDGTCTVESQDSIINASDMSLTGDVTLTGGGVIVNDGNVTYQGNAGRTPTNGVISVELHNRATGNITVVDDTLSLLAHGDNAGTISLPVGTVLYAYNTFSSVPGGIQGGGEIIVVIADLVLQSHGTDLTLTWSPAFNANGYNIYCADQPYENILQYTFVASTLDTTYTIFNGASGTHGFFRVTVH